MKRFIFLTMVTVGLALAAPAMADPVTMAPTPAAMTAATSPKPVALFKSMAAPVLAAMAVTPDAMATTKPAAMEAPKPDAKPKAAESKPAASAPKVTEPTPKWKTVEFWITSVALPILLFVMGLGWIKKSWLVYLKEKGILVVADKVANGFESFAKGTSAKWDDAMALALKAVVARFGELTPKQEAAVKAVVKDRQAMAEKKNGDG